MEAKNKVKLEEPSKSYIPPTTLFTPNVRPIHKNLIQTGSKVGPNTQYSLLSICFNPYCILPYSRIFQKTHSHNNIQACRKWVIEVQKLGQCLGLEDQIISKVEKTKQKPKKKKKKDDQVQQIQKEIKEIKLDVGRKSIQQNIKQWKIIGQISWSKYFQDFKQVFMDKISKQFDQALTKIANRIQNVKGEQVIAQLTQFYQNIKKRSKNQIQLRKQLEYITQSYLSPLIDKTISIRCPDIKDIQMPVFNSFTSLLQTKVISQIQQDLKLEQVNQNDHQQFKQYMLGDTLASFNKYQQIASLCGKKGEEFVLKQKSISLRCPFCTHTQKDKISVDKIQQQLKMIKKQLATQMLAHCFSCHYSLIYQKYQVKKKSKNNNRKGAINTNNDSRIKQICFHDFVEQFQKDRYKNLHIIDRETGLTIMPKYDPNTYCIQVVSRPNIRMAKGKYMVSNDRKCTQFLINYMVIYIFHVKELLSIENVKIDSNSKEINRVMSIIEMLTKRLPKTDQIKNKREYLHKNQERDDDRQSQEDRQSRQQREQREQRQQRQQTYNYNNLYEEEEQPNDRSGNNWQNNNQMQERKNQMEDDEEEQGQINQNKRNQRQGNGDLKGQAVGPIVYQDFSFNCQHMQMIDPVQTQNNKNSNGQQHNVSSGNTNK